jgi:hypothetical protein
LHRHQRNTTRITNCAEARRVILAQENRDRNSSAYGSRAVCSKRGQREAGKLSLALRCDEISGELPLNDVFMHKQQAVMLA